MSSQLTHALTLPKTRRTLRLLLALLPAQSCARVAPPPGRGSPAHYPPLSPLAARDGREWECGEQQMV